MLDMREAYELRRLPPLSVAFVFVGRPRRRCLAGEVPNAARISPVLE